MHVRIQEKEPTFLEIQELVGGYFTLINVIVENNASAVMYINEEGELAGLSLNREASNLAGFDIFGDTVLWLAEGSPVL